VEFIINNYNLDYMKTLLYSENPIQRKINALYTDMKEKEKLLGSFPVKMVSMRDKLKKEISEIQLKINKLKSEL